MLIVPDNLVNRETITKARLYYPEWTYKKYKMKPYSIFKYDTTFTKNLINRRKVLNLFDEIFLSTKQLETIVPKIEK